MQSVSEEPRERVALPWRFVRRLYTARQAVYKLNLVAEQREGFLEDTSRVRMGTNEDNQRPIQVFPRQYQDALHTASYGQFTKER